MPTAAPTHVQRLVANELAAALTAYSWPGDIATISATVRRVPDYTTEDLGTLKVSIVPGPVTLRTATRSDDMFEVSVGVVLAKLVTSEAEISSLEDLNMAIINAIRSELVEVESLPSGADWTEIALPVPYDRESLTERNVFLSQIEVTFQVPIEKIAGG
jgi:hypothetical protein